MKCEIPVNYKEFENSFKFHLKTNPVLHSPPKNFQPASPQHVRNQHEVSAAVRDSNLFQRMKAVNTLNKEPVKPTPQLGVWSEPYIPLPQDPLSRRKNGIFKNEVE